ncbi:MULTISPECIES: hypothetical protein [Streptomyces]|nr:MULTISPECIES: hypothetical protein [Streptomyces]
MSRHTAPTCHGRRMKLDPKTRQYVCSTCKSWTSRLFITFVGVIW